MNFLNELRSNYRLRIGVTLIVSIVWLSFLLDLRDQNNALIDQYRQTASQLARFNSKQKQTQWLARAAEAKEALASAEGGVWQNPTLGLTQAEMRDWLLRQLLESKAARYTVKVSESGGDNGDSKNVKSTDSPTDLIRVRAQIEFNTDPAVLNGFLSTLAKAEHQIVVETLKVRQPRTELTVASWHKLQPVVSVSNAASSAAAQ